MSVSLIQGVDDPTLSKLFTDFSSECQSLKGKVSALTTKILDLPVSQRKSHEREVDKLNTAECKLERRAKLLQGKERELAGAMVAPIAKLLIDLDQILYPAKKRQEEPLHQSMVKAFVGGMIGGIIGAPALNVINAVKIVASPSTPGQKINSLMQIAAPAIGSAIAGGIATAAASSQEPSSGVTTLPPDTVFKTVTRMHESVDSQVPVSVTREIGMHRSLPSAVVWHSETQPIAVGQHVPPTPLPVPKRFASSSSGPIPVPMGTIPPATLVASITAIKPSIQPITQPASAQQELSSAERLRKLATDPNKKRVPSELPTLEEALHEQGMEFADGTGKPGTQATAQTVRWRWLLGASDQEIKEWRDSIYAKENDVDAKRAQLPDLTQQVVLAEENLEKANSPEEALSYAEKLQIANEKFEEGLKRVKEAAWELEKATDHDARKKVIEKKFFQRGDFSDEVLRDVSHNARDFQKDYLNPILENAAKRKENTEQTIQTIASYVRSSKIPVASAPLIAKPPGMSSIGQDRQPSIDPSGTDQPISSFKPSSGTYDLGISLTVTEDYSSMPLIRHFVLQNTKRALSANQGAGAIPDTPTATEASKTTDTFFTHLAEINGLEPGQPYVSDATLPRFLNGTMPPFQFNPRMPVVDSSVALDPLRFSLDTGVLGGSFFNADDLFLGTIKSAGLGVIGIGKGTYRSFAFFKNKIIIHQIEKQLLKLDPVTLQHTLNSIPRIESVNLLKFTEDNLRPNLMRVTGVDPGSKVAHAHHSVPKNWAKPMAEIGINVHDPKFAAWWEARSHLQNAQEYNLMWDKFLQNDRTIDEIFNKALEMSERYNFKTNL